LIEPQHVEGHIIEGESLVLLFGVCADGERYPSERKPQLLGAAKFVAKKKNLTTP